MKDQAQKKMTEFENVLRNITPGHTKLSLPITPVSHCSVLEAVVVNNGLLQQGLINYGFTLVIVNTLPLFSYGFRYGCCQFKCFIPNTFFFC